ncbi:hypothetical protein [Leucobacter chinensis]|uniref:hypothetical protein n=1 Tax=Leucobacter chinensis TaxID=2851010 RepID=UPI001C238B3B|nr:hypothetical protein [Leucobacter chinensis]
MRAGTKLALYGAGLVVAFAASYGLAGVLVPDSVVHDWNERASMTEEHGDRH